MRVKPITSPSITRCAIKAEQQGTAFAADRHGAWREALCVIEDRTVANDNTIAWSGRRLQLPQTDRGVTSRPGLRPS
jgi:hypothetical protein